MGEYLFSLVRRRLKSRVFRAEILVYRELLCNNVVGTDCLNKNKSAPVDGNDE